MISSCIVLHCENAQCGITYVIIDTHSMSVHDDLIAVPEPRSSRRLLVAVSIVGAVLFSAAIIFFVRVSEEKNAMWSISRPKVNTLPTSQMDVLDSPEASEAQLPPFGAVIIDDIAALPADTTPIMGEDNPKQSPAVSGSASLIPADRYVTYSYGDDPLQVYDVFRPSGATGQRPLVILMHGGASDTGDKSKVAERAQIYRDRLGAVTVAPNYRYETGTRQDVACVIAVARSRAAEFGADPEKVVVHGFSYGAFLTSFALYYDSPATLLTPRCPVRDVALLIQPYAYVAEAGQFGWPPGDTNPYQGLDDVVTVDGALRYVGGTDPVTFFIHGKNDKTHAYQRSVDMHAAVQASGTATDILLTNGTHNPGFRDADAIQDWLFGKLTTLSR